MLINHTVTQTMRLMTKRYLNIQPAVLNEFPAPQTGHRYMLYAHVPFCESLCPYCSFNRFVYHEERARLYFENLRREMLQAARQGYVFETLYIGGGTPTVRIDELIRTIELAHSLFPIKEVSCETNPNHMTRENAKLLSPYIQRMSVGVQSFNDDFLKHMIRYDRFGSGDSILRQLSEVQGIFKFLNIDMIFNLPGQTEAVLLDEVDHARRCGSNQVTFYPLMSSPSVARAMDKTLGVVDYRNEEKLYKLIVEALRGSFSLSTVWNFNRDGEAESQKMIDEYVVNNSEYVGIGSGSFSYLDGRLYVNTFSVQDYNERVGGGGLALTGSASYGRKQRMLYRFMMELFGLRLEKAKFRAEFGLPVDLALAVEIQLLQAAGAFERNDAEVLTLSERGRYLLLIMMREFFVGMNHVRDQARASLPASERLQMCVTTA